MDADGSGFFRAPSDSSSESSSMGASEGGERRLIGAMIESHLIGGRQDTVSGQPLTYGQSITDSCIAWEETVPLIARLAEAVRRRRSIPGG